ncbi:MAG: fused MFS/spermidine synthase [Spirochaetes bacterium]|nr:fused MFS/spermidine synthase [Spirochaetota bacterium]
MIKINTQKSVGIILLIIFFFSGFAGLTYEIVWTRILSIIFGRTTVAVALVVAVYMAGLGLGSIYWGQRVDKEKNNIKIFSILQFGIAVSSFLIMLLFIKMPDIFKSICQIFNVTTETSMVIIFIVSFAVLLIPTFMMGGTFPVMSKAFIKNNEQIGQGIGTLYAVNTLGGIIGAALSGYYLIGNIGQIQTQIFAILISTALGIITFFMMSEKKIIINIEKSSLKTNKKFLNNTEWILKFLIIIAGISGFCALAFEILAARVLGILLMNTTYSFASILVIYLTGVSLGSFIFTKFINNRFNHFYLLGMIMSITGFYIIVLSAYVNRLSIVLTPFNSIFNIPFFYVMAPGIILSTVILFIPAVLMGISFPLICRMYTNNVKEIGTNIGRIYFVNTIGSVIGPLFGSFVLIPLIGVSKGFIIIALLYMTAGLIIFLIKSNIKIKVGIITVHMIVFLVSIFFIKRAVDNYKILPPAFYRFDSNSDKIEYYKETVSGTVISVNDPDAGDRGLFVNNNAACGITYDAIKVVKMLGHLPFLYNTDLKDVLIIGFGIGVTTSEVAKHKINKIDCVEIVPGVKDAAKYYSDYNRNVINDPRLKFMGGDGRNYLLITKNTYDFISCDPIHPTLSSGTLYTKEYFQLCKEHLNDQGVMSQYLPLHKLTTDQFKSIVKTFSSVFPNVNLWIGYSHCVLIGSLKKYELDFSRFKEFTAGFDDDFLTDPYQIAASLLLDQKAVENYSNGARIHADNLPFLEFFNPESTNNDNWHLNLEEIRKFIIDPLKVFKNIDNKERMARYVKAQRFFFDGQVLKNMGINDISDMERFIDLFKRAAELNPENEEIRFVLDTDLSIYNQALKEMNRF